MSGHNNAPTEEDIDQFQAHLLEIHDAFQNQDMVLFLFLISETKINFFDYSNVERVLRVANLLYQDDRPFLNDIHDKFEHMFRLYETFRIVDREAYDWRYLHTAYAYCFYGRVDEIVPFFNKYMKGKCTLSRLREILPAYENALIINNIHNASFMEIIKDIINDPTNKRELGKKLVEHLECLNIALERLNSKLTNLNSH